VSPEKDKSQNSLVLERRQRILQLLDAPADLPLGEFLTRAHRAEGAFLTQLASQLAPIMNRHLRQQPHETYEQKKTLAKWLNAELGALALSIRCPRTGQPAFLVGDVGDDPAKGRFQINATAEDGGRKRTVSSTGLLDLDFIGDFPKPPCREMDASRLSWGRTVRRQDNRGKKR
jgi:hypothetical protein